MVFKIIKGEQRLMRSLFLILTATFPITEPRVGGDGAFFSVRNIDISNPGY